MWLSNESGTPSTATSLINSTAYIETEGAQGSLARNMWKDKNTASAAKEELARWAGIYTLSMEDGGYASATVGKDGNVKISGKLSDGTAVSATSPLLYIDYAGYTACFNVAPSAYKGGWISLCVEFVDAEGGIATSGAEAKPQFFVRQVSRNPQATGYYGDGFIRTGYGCGAYYDKLAKLSDYYDTLKFQTESPVLPFVRKETDFDGSGRKKTVSLNGYAMAMNSCEIAVTVNAKGTAFILPKAAKPAQDKETKEWWYDDGNEGALTLAFTQATGIFKGSWTFWYDYTSAVDYTTGKETKTHTSKKANFEGIVVQGQDAMRGFYLWDATGEYEDQKTGKLKTYKYKKSLPAGFYAK